MRDSLQNAYNAPKAAKVMKNKEAEKLSEQRGPRRHESSIQQGARTGSWNKKDVSGKASDINTKFGVELKLCTNIGFLILTNILR